MVFNLGRSSSSSVYSLFFFFFSCSGAVRALDFTSCGGGRLALFFLLGLVTRDDEESVDNLFAFFELEDNVADLAIGDILCWISGKCKGEKKAIEVVQLNSEGSTEGDAHNRKKKDIPQEPNLSQT